MIMETISETEREELHTVLTNLELDIKNSIEQCREATKPVDLEDPIGRITRIDAIQQQKLAQATLRTLELRLKKVAVALRNIESEDFGICSECGDIIAFGRLLAKPEAHLCVNCQSLLEK